MSALDVLPVELHCMIFRHMTSLTIRCIASTCREMNESIDVRKALVIRTISELRLENVPSPFKWCGEDIGIVRHIVEDDYFGCRVPAGHLHNKCDTDICSAEDMLLRFIGHPEETADSGAADWVPKTAADDDYPFFFYALHSKQVIFRPGFHNRDTDEDGFGNFYPPRGSAPSGREWDYVRGGWLSFK